MCAQLTLIHDLLGPFDHLIVLLCQRAFLDELIRAHAVLVVCTEALHHDLVVFVSKHHSGVLIWLYLSQDLC